MTETATSYQDRVAALLREHPELAAPSEVIVRDASQHRAVPRPPAVPRRRRRGRQLPLPLSTTIAR